mmetsp:Transcript_47419/g.149009  ORF Transcript_47419/g.149009 Transcript_47419/m.149009 type:complete len:228 (+) Transcript_47419:279-962(+)
MLQSPQQQRRLVALTPRKAGRTGVRVLGCAGQVSAPIGLQILLAHSQAEVAEVLDVATSTQSGVFATTGLRLPAPCSMLVRRLGETLREPRVPQRVLHGHPLRGVELHEHEDKVLGLMGERGAPTLLLKEPLVGAALEQLVVGVVNCRVRAVEERLRGQQVERAPAQAPRVDLGGDVVLLGVELRRPELLGHKALERNRHLFARQRVDGEGHRLPGVAHTHLPLAVF